MDIEAEAGKVQSFVDKGNYHAAYNIARFRLKCLPSE